MTLKLQGGENSTQTQFQFQLVESNVQCPGPRGTMSWRRLSMTPRWSAALFELHYFPKLCLVALERFLGYSYCCLAFMYLSFEIKSFQVNGAKAEAELAYSLQAAKVEDLPPHSPSNNPRSRIFALSPSPSPPLAASPILHCTMCLSPLKRCIKFRQNVSLCSHFHFLICLVFPWIPLVKQQKRAKFTFVFFKLHFHYVLGPG